MSSVARSPIKWMLSLTIPILLLAGITAFATVVLPPILIEQFAIVLLGRQTAIRQPANLEFGAHRVRFPYSINWKNIQLYFGLARANSLADGGRVLVRVSNLVLDPSAINILNVRASSIVVEHQSPPIQAGPIAGGVDGFVVALKDFKVTIPVEVLPPNRLNHSVQAATQMVRDFLRTGQSSLDITGTGKLLTRIDDASVEMKFAVIRKDGISRMALDRQDVERLSQFTEEGLTSAEVDLLMRYPAAAPRLFAIQRKASSTAKVLAKKRSGFPEDAYRHVLWSYLLTKTFGSRLALEATDAHEQGENRMAESAADHAMDLNNNRVGVSYAESGLSERYIPDLVLTDKNVVTTSKDMWQRL